MMTWVMHVEEVEEDRWMRKLMTCVEDKEEEVEEDHWTRNLMTDAEEEEDEECQWMVHLLT